MNWNHDDNDITLNQQSFCMNDNINGIKSSLHRLCDILSTKDTICNIFSFLDLKSLLKCEKVCHLWLKFARNPSCIDTFDLFDQFYSNYYQTNKIKQIPTDIIRFRHCKTLKLNINNLSNLSFKTTMISQLAYFNKFESLSLYINYPSRDNNPYSMSVVTSIKNKKNDTLRQIKNEVIKLLSTNMIPLTTLYLFGDFTDKTSIQCITKCRNLTQLSLTSTANNHLNFIPINHYQMLFDSTRNLQYLQLKKLILDQDNLSQILGYF